MVLISPGPSKWVNTMSLFLLESLLGHNLVSFRLLSISGIFTQSQRYEGEAILLARNQRPTVSILALQIANYEGGVCPYCLQAC